MKKLQIFGILLLCLVTSFYHVDIVAADSDISDANSVYFSEIRRLAYDGYGDVDYWSKQTKLLAFRSAVHLTSLAISINKDRDHGAARIIKFKQIVELNKIMIKQAERFAFDGYGDLDYWSKRTKQFATELVIHTSNIASLCDRPMLNAITSRLTSLIKSAQTSAFEGYGSIDYWSRSCKQLATRAVSLLGEISTELATACVQ
ncbi:MAG: hypothetical protein HQM10_11695 [Candidatus Riflebacteria bacterium]|nr:hypothetical protein [Candidatus Riflebacteria bacterium]